MQQLLPLAFHELGHRYARPLGHDGGYLLLGYGVVHHGVGFALLASGFRLLQLLFQSRQVGILKLRRLLIIVSLLGVFNVGVHLFYLALELFRLVNAALF